MGQRDQHHVQNLFNKLAPTYDRMNNIISLGTHRYWRQQTTKMLPLFQGAQVLDDCCGTGDWTIATAEQVGPTGHVTGIDFSPEMLKVARQKIAKKHLENRIHLLQGDALALPFADNSFDFVTIGFGLRNVTDRNQALREIHRVLKPGGILGCLETSQPTLPIIHFGWQLYFRYLVPLFGKVFVNEYREYRYLQTTTQNFMNYQQLADRFRQSGFKDVHYRRFNLGAAAAHFGTKPRYSG